MLQTHNEFLDDHRRICMDEYKREYRKMETRYCNIHTDQVYLMVCRECSLVSCIDCVDELTDCSAGKLTFS